MTSLPLTEVEAGNVLLQLSKTDRRTHRPQSQSASQPSNHNDASITGSSYNHEQQLEKSTHVAGFIHGYGNTAWHSWMSGGWRVIGLIATALSAQTHSSRIPQQCMQCPRVLISGEPGRACGLR